MNVEDKVYVLSTIRNKKVIKKYRVVHMSDGSVEDIEIGMSDKASMLIQGVHYDNGYKCLVSDTDVSLTELPYFDMSYTLLSKQGTFILNEVYDSNNNIIGYTVLSGSGEARDISLKSIQNVADNTRPINYTLVGGMAKPKRGYFFNKVLLSKYKSSSFRSADNEFIDKVEEIKKVPVYSLHDVYGSEWNTSANEKMMLAQANLKLAYPYYWVLLQAMKKQPCDDKVTKSLAVSEDTFYYNIGFISSITDSELLFIFIHEIMHVSMRHVFRIGKREPKQWNIACDLYINEMIVHSLGLTIGSETSVSCKLGDKNYNIKIKAPKSGLYFSKIGEPCDLSKDLPELIYNRLKKEENSQKGGGSSEQSDSNSEQGDSSSYTYNGKKLDGDTLDTMLSETGQSTPEQKEASGDLSKQVVQNMKTRKELVEEKTGKDLTAGDNASQLVQRMIEFGLKGTVDWRSVLKNIILEKPRKKYTLGSPEQTYMNMGITLATRQRIGKPDSVKNIIIAIDNSGSISDKILNKFISEVASMYNFYNVDGELLYWNTSVCDSGLFTDRQGLQRVNANASGGTDVRCVFDYLVGKSSTLSGKHEKIKARDIKAVLIVTDGYFSRNYEDYEGVFGRKVLWLIDGAAEVFNPCFGQVISLNDNMDK